MPANQDIVAEIIKVARELGIDPEVALEVARREALNVFDPSKPDRGGDQGSSFGPFQLHYGGVVKSMPNPGMGDDFTRATGLDARDPSTWPQQVRFALTQARQGGWGPWMGAKAAGITGMEGIGGVASNYVNSGRGQRVGTESYAPAPTNPNVGSTIDFKRAETEAATGKPAGTPQAFPVEGGGSSGDVDWPMGTPSPFALPEKDKPKNWLEVLGSGMADAAKAKLPAVPGNRAAHPGASIVDAPQPAAPVVPIGGMDPAKREQFALIMQRLNTGRLFG